jgi:hypothetical protein
MFMHRVGHQPMRRYIAIIPQSTFDRRGHFCTGVYFYFLGTDHGPATFSLDPPICRLGAWPHMTQTITMRHLEKTIFGGHRPYRYRLE